MAGDIANPRIWLGADVYVAPVGSTAPVDVTTAYAAAWVPLGLLSEDGMTENREDDKTDHYDWTGLLVRTTRSKHKRTFRVTALEDNKTVWALANPGSTATSVSPLTTRTVKLPIPDPRAFSFELKDGAITKRLLVAKGEVTEVGDVVYSAEEMTMKELTISVYPSAAFVLYTEILNDLSAVVP